MLPANAILVPAPAAAASEEMTTSSGVPQDLASPKSPSGASDSFELVQAVLLRNKAGRFNLTFKHDSFHNIVAIEAVGESDVPDERASVKMDDYLVSVNGVKTVRACSMHGTQCPRIIWSSPLNAFACRRRVCRYPKCSSS